MLVSFEDINRRLDVPVAPAAEARVTLLIEDAEEMIRTAFLRCGRDFNQALVTVPWLGAEVRRVIREMVSAALLVGPNAGVRSVSSTTGQESDSITYADVDSVSFGGVRLTDAQRAQLGLCMPGGARGKFPQPRQWPEVHQWPR